MGKTAKDIRRMARDVIGPIPPARCFEERRATKYKNYMFEYDEEDMWNVDGDSEEDDEEGENENV